MKRRALLLGAMALPLSGRAQSSGRLPRVGYLSMTSRQRDVAWVRALREGLRDVGRPDGEKLILDERHAPNDAARALEHAADLVRHEAVVILAYASPVLPALRKQITEVPIVFLAHADPVAAGVVPSLARPGGNVTGLTDGHGDLAPKRLELLRELVPTATRIAVLFNPQTHTRRQYEMLTAAAPGVGVTIVPVEIHAPSEIERCFEAMQARRVQGVVIAPDPTWSAGQERRTADSAKAHRIPAIGSVGEFADEGLLLAYGTNFAALWRRSAAYVDKILRGAKPADLPVESPTLFDLVINLRTASALGIKVPRGFAMRADRVIE